MVIQQRDGRSHDRQAAEKTQPAAVSAPSLSLPKGGGAVRGMGEKFAANPVTGTGSMTVPIATSPGRSGFGPQLSLSYDSGAGNGPFGFGWSLSLPSITRKTDKGLPKYQDADESDVFILSGAEDLVPVLINTGGGKWEREPIPPRTIDVDKTYRIQRYRPRIEGLFARIERWTNLDKPEDTFWRSISKDNITTWYGKTPESRIADPTDQTRTFSWLICESHDDKGNVIVYDYKGENSDGIDLTQVHERNRTDTTRAANRYLKRIRYGNHAPYFPILAETEPWPTPPGAFDLDGSKDWFFEVVLDYDDHNLEAPLPYETGKKWPRRIDPFSSYRAGFEVRTYRLCQRVLMFHHFPDEAGVGNDCLVRSTEFTYSHEQDPTSARNPVYTFLRAVTQSGYKRDNGGDLKRSLPPVEFDYTQPVVQDMVEEVEAESLENLPVGLDGAAYQWTDLHGEGIPGILTEQGGAWFYKRNLSPINVKPGNGPAHTEAKFAPVEWVAVKPNLALTGGQAQFMDLAGDGQPDLVVLDGPMPGLYEHDGDEGWQPFRPFTSHLNHDTRDPNLKFVDLDGDGHADILITEDDAFVWHASLAEEGFGPACRVARALDEEKGPRLVFADGTQSIYLADLSGDGLTDLVRIRNGEVCYWPNLGYGRFGAKVTMDHGPHFDNPDQFDHKRIRLADIDGTGTTDIIYLHRDGVRLYFNQSGNSWSEPQVLRVFPRIDDLVSIVPTDLLGNGTACLVWSSPLPGDARRPMRYVDLMGGQKPHLLVRSVNNLGAETRVAYAPSTKFYLQDKRDGNPWITRLPFPVHVVERVETYDRISRNRFVTRYAYHHGHFDGGEREFRGFGMVEQFDTEAFAALSASDAFPVGDNIDQTSHVPPVLTRTWFHTGAYLEGGRMSRQFENDYYREGDPSLGEAGLTDDQWRAMLLDDTRLPNSVLLLDGRYQARMLSPDEAREACRALKSSILRQEIYAQDGSEEQDRPYSVSERNYTLEWLQPQEGQRHAVFFAHPRETIDFHYERKLFDVDVGGQRQKLADPRVSHAMTLAVDYFGNVLQSVAIGYGRRHDDPDPVLTDADRNKQKQPLITYTDNRFTTPVEEPDDYRTPLPCETRTYELLNVRPDANAPLVTNLFRLEEMRDKIQADGDGLPEIPYEDVDATGVVDNAPYRRPIEHMRSLFRRNDLTGPLPFEELQSLALPYEQYRLAFTQGLARQIYVDSGKLGANALNSVLADEGKYVHSEGDADWWIPSGRMFYAPGSTDSSAELAYARQHFFLPRRYRDPFHTQAISTESVVTYDAYDLLMVETRDALGNRVTVGERDAAGNLSTAGNDYRVLQPRLMMDPNRNRTALAFDALGMVVGTAVMGKPLPAPVEGDSLDGFEADLTEAVTLDHLANPMADPQAILARATTRLVYDLFAYQRTKDQPDPQPAVACTLARETHDSDPVPSCGLKIQHSFSYSDGFGREIQKKIQAEAGPLVESGPEVSPRWVGSGWTIFNNKGKPIRQYEPFFTDTYRFEFARIVGVSPILFYDLVERVVATLHPNHTWEKVVFDPWRQETWDVNDTVTFDPRSDEDVKGFFLNPDGTPRLPEADYLPTWHALRSDPAHAAEANQKWPDPRMRNAEKDAADKAAVHAETPTIAHFDALGRAFLTVAHNKFKRSDTPPADAPTEEFYHTRVLLDIEGNQREVRDAIVQAGDPLGRVVMRYDYDLLGNRVHQTSMEAGERWMLNDVASKPIRAWDSRGHHFRTEYDPLRRPLRQFVRGTDANRSDPRTFNQDVLFEKVEYGEGQANDFSVRLNLRTRVFRQYDSAGIVTSLGLNPATDREEAYDFKGNLLRSARELVQDYKSLINWATPRQPGEMFSSSTTYDALNRPTAVTTPDKSVYRPTYNGANLLDTVEVNLRGERDNTEQPKWTLFVTNINYNAKGQRALIHYQNGAETTYQYDEQTFRLTNLKTTRPPGLNGLTSGIFANPATIQDLRYIYDPVGNIAQLADAALTTVIYAGQTVEPVCRYTYDAVYRLIEATGREHIDQSAFQFAPANCNYRDYPFVGPAQTNDPRAVRNYTERYEYDPVGNFERMMHRATSGRWTRAYEYQETSLIEDGRVTPRKTSNRLSRTTLQPDGNQPIPEPYTYDAHGNTTTMPHLPLMQWDFQDQLRASSKQVTNDCAPETTFYIYDGAGQRVRKVTERQNGTRKDERLYLGGFEIFRAHNGAGTTVTLEREILHIKDDTQRIALVETRTQGDDGSPAQLIRYQFGNHLGSTSLELASQAQIISYEEYYPYGCTSYQAVRSQTETPNHYRYTGKERDEETGFYYHGARYYAPWLSRWVNPDPIGLQGGINRYQYVSGNPLRMVDPSGTQEVEGERQAVKTPNLEEVLRHVKPEDREWLRKWYLNYSAGKNPVLGHAVPKLQKDVVTEEMIQQGLIFGLTAPPALASLWAAPLATLEGFVIGEGVNLITREGLQALGVDPKVAEWVAFGAEIIIPIGFATASTRVSLSSGLSRRPLRSQPTAIRPSSRPQGRLFGIGDEWVIRPGLEQKVERSLKWLRNAYQRSTGGNTIVETGEIIGGKKPVSHERPSSHVIDVEGAGGWIDPKTGQIHIFDIEKKFAPGVEAEELLHYFQLKKRGLLGKKEADIGEAIILELETEVRGLLEELGFESLWKAGKRR